MALFLVLCRDRPGALETWLANRPAHLIWIETLGPHLRMAGAILAEDGETLTGSIPVLEADDIDTLRTLRGEDPYQTTGLFEEVEVRPFRWVAGNGRPA